MESLTGRIAVMLVIGIVGGIVAILFLRAESKQREAAEAASGVATTNVSSDAHSSTLNIQAKNEQSRSQNFIAMNELQTRDFGSASEMAAGTENVNPHIEKSNNQLERLYNWVEKTVYGLTSYQENMNTPSSDYDEKIKYDYYKDINEDDYINQILWNIKKRKRMSNSRDKMARRGEGVQYFKRRKRDVDVRYRPNLDDKRIKKEANHETTKKLMNKKERIKKEKKTDTQYENNSFLKINEKEKEKIHDNEWDQLLTSHRIRHQGSKRRHRQYDDDDDDDDEKEEKEEETDDDDEEEEEDGDDDDDSNNNVNNDILKNRNINEQSSSNFLQNKNIFESSSLFQKQVPKVFSISKITNSIQNVHDNISNHTSMKENNNISTSTTSSKKILNKDANRTLLMTLAASLLLLLMLLGCLLFYCCQCHFQYGYSDHLNSVTNEDTTDLPEEDLTPLGMGTCKIFPSELTYQDHLNKEFFSKKQITGKDYAKHLENENGQGTLEWNAKKNGQGTLEWNANKNKMGDQHSSYSRHLPLHALLSNLPPSSDCLEEEDNDRRMCSLSPFAPRRSQSLEFLTI